MSRIVNGVIYIEPTAPENCELCGKHAELRPYGPNNEKICHDCGMKDPETTMKKMNENLFDKATLINPKLN